MEINLQNLAELQRPQQMTNDTMLGGAGAGGMYGDQMGRFQDTLSQISPIAQMAGQVQTQGLQNQLADQPLIEQTRANKLQEANLKAMIPYTSAYESAKTEDEKRYILSQMDDDTAIKNKKPLKDMPLELADKMMSTARAMAVNTPEQAQKEAIWGTRTAADLAKTGMKTTSAENIAAQNNQTKLTQTEMQTAAKTNAAKIAASVHPANYNNAIMASVQQMSGSPEEKMQAMLEMAKYLGSVSPSAYGAQTAAGMKAPPIDMAPLGIKTDTSRIPPTAGSTPIPESVKRLAASQAQQPQLPKAIPMEAEIGGKKATVYKIGNKYYKNPDGTGELGNPK